MASTIRPGEEPSARRFQALHLAVEIHSSVPEVLAAAEFLEHDAAQPESPLERVVFMVQPRGGEYVVCVDGAVIDRAPDADAVRETLFAHVTTRMLARYPEHALVRGAAVLRDGGRRVLLVGEPGCGLTSLAVRLLHRDALVEGDAFALLGADGLTPLPRRLMLREGTRTLLPELADSLDRLPTAASGAGVVWGYDPSRAGFPWVIERGPIDACVVVDASHGADSRLVALSATDAVRRVVAQCTPPAAGGSRWLRDVVRLLDGAACARLVLGRLEDAVTTVRRAWTVERSSRALPA